jgi:predicted ATPase
VAYGSVLVERRKALHERTGQAIEALYSSSLEDHYSELAHHYSRSGNTRKAVEYLQLAGQQAVQRSAYAEAISHLSSALELFKTLPDTPERIQQELTLQITLGAPLVATKGMAAPEVGAVYNRARELCQRVGKTPQLSPVLFALHRFYAVRAELQAAREIAEQHLKLAQSIQDPALLLSAHLALGAAWLWLGEFVPAREHLEQGIASYDPQQHRSLAFLYGENPGVTCFFFAAWALWHLGSPDQALKSSDDALTLARELSHPHSLAEALLFAAMLHQFRREMQTAQERAEAVITLSTEQGFPLWLALGTILRGWVLTEQGQGEEGITQMRQGLAAHRATGAELWRSYHLALLAEAYGKTGQVEEGLTALAEALAVIDKNGERHYEAELYRLKGELTLQKLSVASSQLSVTNPQSLTPNPQAEAEAEACFLKAIEIARQQQAKSLELRATTSLARLWQQQGKQKDAHQMLVEIYGWFTEGFDTADLQEAKALLEELSH